MFMQPIFTVLYTLHMQSVEPHANQTQLRNHANPGLVRLLPFLFHSRSIISECLASFMYVFIVCGAAAGVGVGASVSSVLLATALASGLAMATLTQCFLHISGKSKETINKRKNINRMGRQVSLFGLPIGIAWETAVFKGAP